MAMSRRNFVKTGFTLGAAGLLPFALTKRALAQGAPPLLDPTTVPQFVNACPNPLAPNFRFQASSGSSYKILITPGQADLGLGQGRLTHYWGYAYERPNGTVAPPTFPGRSFFTNSGSGITVSYNNRLVDSSGRPLPHAMPVDTSLHWANPGGLGGLAPVPLVAHRHGGDNEYLSDGLPDGWNTPSNAYKGRLFSTPYLYSNNQEAGHLWYHDHALGITRLNGYMGLSGNYIIRDTNELSLISSHVLPSEAFEVGLTLTDRQFTAEGELFYPAEDPTNPNAGYPTHLPEFFGDVILVNGKAWPVLDVEPRKYRFRILDASDSRVYDLALSNGAPFLHVGAELGLLNRPEPAAGLSIAPGERLDVIIDFRSMAGSTVMLNNSANAPYPGGDLVDPATTGRVMAFRVAAHASSAADATVNVNTNLRPGNALPTVDHLVGQATVTRRILLFEGTDAKGRLQTMLGPVDPVRDMSGATVQGTLLWADPVTENPAVGATEVWEFYNSTADAHPIHVHLVDYRVINRQKFSGTISPKTNTACDGSIVDGGVLSGVRLQGSARGPRAGENGKKDTAKMFPGEVTRIVMNFKRPGEYVYHCHILSHEDHEMMRRYIVDRPGAPASGGTVCNV
jgi:spore coat protein A